MPQIQCSLSHIISFQFDANIDDLAEQMQNYEAVQDIHAEQTVGGFAPLL